MNNLKEYPKGRGRAEMLLVRMLQEQRSWDDIQRITDALWNIRFHADNMKKEHDLLHEDSGCSEQAVPDINKESPASQ